ncbi:DUF4339 domain-containing protein [Sphingobacterium hungaricum]
MEIYFAKNGKQIGPIEFEKLDPFEISQNTKVWFKGLDNWKEAAGVELFEDYFINQNTIKILNKSHSDIPSKKYSFLNLFNIKSWHLFNLTKS